MSSNHPASFAGHPCFSAEGRHRFGRLHLPVAPRCNLQCNFCNRKFDCMNESRPGVTSRVLTPQQAAAYAAEMVSKRPEISVVGIAGPGDPFANADETLSTLRLVREQMPEILLCVATNGLNIGPYIAELGKLRVSHVTLTITATDPAIGKQVYAWIRDGKRPLRGEAAAALLISNQLDAIPLLKKQGIVVKINSILIPGVNDDHIITIADQVKTLGADIMNVIPMLPVADTVFEHISPPDNLTVARVRLTCGLKLPQMSHCSRCRADAAGLIGEPPDAGQMTMLQKYADMNARPDDSQTRPYVAVASFEGAFVNQHLGEADRFLIYGHDEKSPDQFRLREIRIAPKAGGGDRRWHELATVLGDCRALLVNAAGPAPSRVLTERGIRVAEMEGLIEEGLSAVFAGKPIPPALKRAFTNCGAGVTCKGAGTGCG